MFCNWEGSRRSGVTLGTRQTQVVYPPILAQGLRKGDEHPTNTPHDAWYSLSF